MAQKGKVSVDSEEEIRQIEKDLEEELRYAVASAKGIVPADAVIKIERKKGRPQVVYQQNLRKLVVKSPESSVDRPINLQMTIILR